MDRKDSPSGISPSSSPHQVLPPIIANEADRLFLQDLDNFIDVEILKIDQTSPEQRYTVHKAAFDKVIDHVSAYKPILTAIKAEYEETIDTIRRGQKEAAYLNSKVRAMAAEPTTRRNYQKRSDELEQKITFIKDDNERLERQVAALRKARLEKEQLEKQFAEQKPPKAVKKERRVTPGLTAEQATDKRLLTAELLRLEKEAKALSISKMTKYLPKENKNHLRVQLAQKVATRDTQQQRSEILKAKRLKLKMAVDGVAAYNRLQPVHQTVADAILMTLAKTQPGTEQVSQQDKEPVPLFQETPSASFEEDDPMREKEAELILEYIEKFNELFEGGSYEEAATHAANSPKGVLRTMETMNRFKLLPKLAMSGRRSPLLCFSDALMSSVLATGVKPNEALSMECVKCVLEENRMDLLSQWVTQNRLTISEQLGNAINDYCKNKSRQYLTLAESIFTKVGAYRQVVVAMLLQGRVHAALECAKQQGRFDENDYLFALTQCPSQQLAQQLVESFGASSTDSRNFTDHKQHRRSTSVDRESTRLSTSSSETNTFPVEIDSLLPLGVVVTTLLNKGMEDIALLVVQDIYDKYHSEDVGSSHMIRRYVFSDKVTSPEQWAEIIAKCQKEGYDNIAMELLAANTVLRAMSRAMSMSSTPQGSLSTSEGYY